MQLSLQNILWTWPMIFTCISAVSYLKMTDLRSNLSAGYSKNVRPLENQGKALSINAVYTLKSLNNFDVVSGRITTVGLFHLTWTDEKMTWTPANYGGINKVTFPESDVWAPIIFVVNGADDIYTRTARFGDTSISFKSTGFASYLLKVVMTTTCDPDIAYYPYDVHICSMTLTAEEPVSEVQISIQSVQLRPEAEQNLLWKIVNMTYRDYTESNIAFVEISVTIERRPSYLILTVLIPICLLSFLNLLAFLLPADSGERVSFSITMLLTLALYMTIMSDSIPNTSDPVSILTISLITKLVYSGMTVLAVVISLRVNLTDENKPIPLWLIRLSKFRNSVGSKNQKIDDCTVEDFTEKTENKGIHGLKTTDTDAVTPLTWRSIGRTLDVIFFMLFTFITLVETIFNVVRIVYRTG